MKIGLNKYENHQWNCIEEARFVSLATIRNGIITEDIGLSSCIYELYKIKMYDWSYSNYENTIAANDDGYVLLGCGCGAVGYYVLSKICLGLTQKDRNDLINIRDASLVA
jgi:hypothetical protein